MLSGCKYFFTFPLVNTRMTKNPQPFPVRGFTKKQVVYQQTLKGQFELIKQSVCVVEICIRNVTLLFV